jgi:hypothetical protein
MTLNAKKRHNIKRAIHLAMEGNSLGFILINFYCQYGNDVAKAVVCTPLIFKPEFAIYAPCCIKHLNLAIQNARKIGVPEPIIQRAVAVILGEGSTETRSGEREKVGTRKRRSKTGY